MRATTFCLLTLVMTLFVAACGAGAPPEAQAALTKGLAALKAKDKAAFAAAVLPDQRKGALGLPAELGIKGDKPVKDYTLEDLLDVEFFADMKNAEPNTDLISVDGDSTARLGATIYFDEGYLSVKSFVLKKTSDGWLIDMKATIDWWVKLDGGKALGAMTLK